MIETHVLIRAAGQQWAAPSVEVAEVVASLTVTRVPGMPGWVTGLADWRGRTLAVADLGLLMGSDIRAMGPVLVLHRDGVELGLACQEAMGTIEIDAGAGQVINDGEDVAIIDVTACFALRSELGSGVVGVRPEA